MSNSQFFLVNVGIGIECFDKNLIGLYQADSDMEAKIQAIEGECHNIDQEDDADVQHWHDKIAEQLSIDGSVEDDDYNYSITSCRALDLTHGMLNGETVELVVLAPTDDKSTDEEVLTQSNAASDRSVDETPYLTRVEWKNSGYEKYLDHIVWALDADSAMKEAVLLESEDLPDQEDDEEDYNAMRSNLIKRIEESDDISNNEYSGLYRAEWAVPLQKIDFMLNNKACSGFINPEQQRQPYFVYMEKFQ